MELENSFKSMLAQIQAKAEARQSVTHEPATEPEPVQASARAKVVQLPLWANETRGVPNAVLRSALFGAIKRGRRAFMQRVAKASVDGLTVLQTGPQLDQSDLDVWEQCMHLAKDQGLGTRIEFTAHSFLKSIDRTTGKSQHEWLKGAFARLASSVVEIKDGKRAYFGAMIHHGTRDDDSGRYVIEINPAIAKLYGSDGWTAVEREQRLALKKQPLAQWLHGFYSTHASPYAFKIETLHKLCGSETSELRSFTQTLKKSLAAVCAETGWTWNIDESGLVHVKKLAIGTQKRHLARKAKKARHSTCKGTA
ncbi:MAG: plasmid replication initiator TrfA [Kiritimatiellia bacterium]